MGERGKKMINIGKDNGYEIYLSTDTKPTVAQDKDIILEVDTAVWYVFYQGTWYPQNVTPIEGE